MMSTVPENDIEKILHADHHDPFAVLGAHLVHVPGGEPVVAVRAYLPDASAAWVVEDSTRAEHPMELIHREGFFEAVFPGHQEVFAYWLKKAHPDGSTALTLQADGQLAVIRTDLPSSITQNSASEG